MKIKYVPDENSIASYIADMIYGDTWLELPNLGGLVAMLMYLSESSILDFGPDGVNEYIMRIMDRYSCEQRDPDSKVHVNPGFYISIKDSKVYWALKSERAAIPPNITIQKITAERSARTVYDYTFHKWEEDNT